MMRGVLTAAFVAACAAAQAPAIAITSVPPYAQSGALAGTVTGVAFATHRVAVYIQIEGAGWWTKPAFAAPTVPIQPDGSFAANVTSGGLDDRATLFVVALLAPGVNPPLANGSAFLPAVASLAMDVRERYARTIAFAGRSWAVKEAPLAVGPGGNRFTAGSNDVFVDAQGRLHLRVRFDAGAWRCSEVMLADDLGHGTYWFTTESEVEDLDANLVFGAFTWDPFGDDATIPSWPHREIDFEDARWGNAGDPTTSQRVVQPFAAPGNLQRYTTPDLAGAPTLTRAITWSPARIEFFAARGRGSACTLPPASVVHRSVYLHDPQSGRFVPPAGRERFHFNLWLHGGAPQNGMAAEVIVSDFRFAPAPGVLVGGCGRNPRGSMRVLGHSPAPGGTLVLGIDNPAGSQGPGSWALLALALLPDPAFPCGTVQPGWGMTAAGGELQIALPTAVLAALVPWAGPGQPAPFPVAIPTSAVLVGLPVWAQGALFDPRPGASFPLGLADAVEFCIGA